MAFYRPGARVQDGLGTYPLERIPGNWSRRHGYGSNGSSRHQTPHRHRSSPPHHSYLLGPRYHSRPSNSFGHRIFFNDHYHPSTHPKHPCNDSHLPNNDTEPFGHTIARFHATLSRARSFYASFKRDFDRDVRSVQAYAGTRILTELWRRKVAAGTTPIPKPQRNNNGNNDNNDNTTTDHNLRATTSARERAPLVTEPLWNSFDSVQRSLAASFAEALSTTPRWNNNTNNGSSSSRRRSRTRGRGMRESSRTMDEDRRCRLLSKVRTAAQDVAALVKGVKLTDAALEHLLAELELLMLCLEKNRAVWDVERANSGGRRDGRGGCHGRGRGAMWEAGEEDGDGDEGEDGDGDQDQDPDEGAGDGRGFADGADDDD